MADDFPETSIMFGADIIAFVHSSADHEPENEF